MQVHGDANIEAHVYLSKELKGNILAKATLTIGGCFTVKGIKVLHGKNGIFVSMPQIMDSKGEWHEIFYPNSKETRDLVSQIVLEKYNALMCGGQQQKRSAYASVGYGA